MLTCIPQSLCTWDFRVLGASAGAAALTFNFLTEQGTISLGSNDFTVRKHGPMSGRWTLEHENQIAAEAHKPSAMFRAFELRVQDVQVAVKAQSPFTRCYDILSGGCVVGSIRPAHAFTRRAFVDCEAGIPELAQLFAFWLAVLTWRRSANSSSSA
jgi:hypothetical protein